MARQVVEEEWVQRRSIVVQQRLDLADSVELTFDINGTLVASDQCVELR